MAQQQRQRQHSDSEQLSHKMSSRSSSGGGGGGSGARPSGKKLSTSSQETGEAGRTNRSSVQHSEETTGSETETDAER